MKTVLPVNALPNPFLVNIWGTKHQLRQEQVFYCLDHGLWKSKPLYLNEDHEDSNLHAMRIAYFVENFDENRLIEVEKQYTKDGDEYLWVIDGNHYLASACILGVKELNCLFRDSRENRL